VESTPIGSDKASWRGAIAGVLAPTSIALILMTFLPDFSEPLSTIVKYAAPLLWVAAVVALVRFDQPAPLAIGAAAAYALAFVLPAETSHDVPGYMAFAFGVQVVPVAWLANPAFVIGLAMYQGGRMGEAFAASGLALLLALTTLVTLDMDVGLGFAVWAVAPALLALAAARRWSPSQA